MDNAPRRINDLVSPTRNTSNISITPDPKTKQKKNKLKLIILAVGVVILLALLIVGGWFVYRSNTSTSLDIDGSKYQAVFFTNGQVYFGRLQPLSGGYMKLTDIFYLQAQATSSSNPQATSSATSDVQLIKLGSEVHGPDDEMVISKDQMLFFENLKNDGKVVQSIAKYKAQK